MGTRTESSNDRFPGAAFAYDGEDANLVNPPLAYGSDLTSVSTAVTCPRPVFAGSSWVGVNLYVWNGAAFEAAAIAAKVSDYAVTLSGAFPSGDVTAEDWFCDLASDDSSVGNVALRYQSNPVPLPCTIFEGVAYVDAIALGDLTAAPYHVPA